MEKSDVMLAGLASSKFEDLDSNGEPLNRFGGVICEGYVQPSMDEFRCKRTTKDTSGYHST